MKRTLGILVAALALVAAPLGGAEAMYSDSAGDSGSAPDITSATLSNTDTAVAFRVEAALVPDSLLGIFIDDRDADTGQAGLDRLIAVTIDEDGAVQALLLDGFFGYVRPLAADVSAHAVAVTIATTDLGIRGAGFDFFVGTADTASNATDTAPDEGLWKYELASVVAKPVIGKPVTTGAPVAGRKFVVSFPITSSSDGGRMTSAIVGCKAMVAGQIVPHTHTFKNGTLKASVRIPMAASGRQLKVAVRATNGTQVTARVFVFKVR